MSCPMRRNDVNVASASAERRPGGNQPSAGWIRQFDEDSSKARQRETLGIWAGRIAVVAVVLGAWQALEAAAVFKPTIISSPSAVISYLGDLLGKSSFYGAVGITFQEMIIGFGIGAVVGAGLGLSFALLPRLSEAMEPVLGGVNAVPKIALAPLTVVWLGLGISSKVLMAAIGVFFVILFNVVSGTKDLDPALRWNATVLGLSRTQIIRIVLLPFTLVWVTTGLRVSISLALVGAVVGEYVGANAGLGYEINAAINGLAVTRMFALLAALAVIGGALYILVIVTEKRVLRWQR